MFIFTVNSFFTTALLFLGKQRKQKILDVVDDDGPLPGFEIGHGTSSKTYYLASVKDSSERIWCDTPGFGDTAGATQSIAHAVAMTSAFNKCKSVRPILLVKYETLKRNMGGGLTPLADLVSKFITKDFETNLSNVRVFFTHVPGDDDFEDIVCQLHLNLQDLEKRTSNVEGAKFVVKHMLAQISKHKDDLILRLDGQKPDKVIELIMNGNPIMPETEAFGSPLSEKERKYLAAACTQRLADSKEFIRTLEFKKVTKTLNELEMLAVASKLPQVQKTYDELLDFVLNIFHGKLDRAKKLMDQERFSDVNTHICAVDERLLRHTKLVEMCRVRTDSTYITVESKLNRLIDTINTKACGWSIDQDVELKKRIDLLKIQGPF